LRAWITPVGGLYVTTGAGIGVGALTLLFYALFPAVIGVVAISGTIKQEEGALPALVLMAASTLGLVGTGVLLGLLSLAYLVVGVGLIARKRWARMAGVGLSVPIMVICMPTSTPVGVLAMVALLNPDTIKEFDAQHAARVAPLP
jgi:hypothetical protein